MMFYQQRRSTSNSRHHSNNPSISRTTAPLGPPPGSSLLTSQHSSSIMTSVWKQGPRGSNLGTLLKNKIPGATATSKTHLGRNGSQPSINSASPDKEGVPRHLSTKEYDALRTFTQILVEKEEAGRNKTSKLFTNST